MRPPQHHCIGDKNAFLTLFQTREMAVDSRTVDGREIANISDFYLVSLRTE